MGVVVEVGVAELPEPDDGEGGKAERPAPAASPSSPSVRLTALVVAVIKSNAHTIQPMRPRSHPGLSKRVNDSVVGTFVYWVTKGEPDTDDQQAQHLRPLVEAQVASGHDLDPVVDQPHRTATDDRKHHEDAGAR